MATHREDVNPLRPYYIPPTIGETPNPLPNAASTGASPFRQGNATTGRYASKARDIFSDIDVKDYISEPSPSAVQTIKQLVDELIWKYTSVLMAQPFEVAKTILQVRSQDDLGGLSTLEPQQARHKASARRASSYEQYPDSESDPDEPDYFTSHAPSTPTQSHMRSSRQRTHTPSPSQSPRLSSRASIPPHQLNLRRPDSIIETISQLWQKEGAWGVWKGSNASFIYSVLQSLMENWSRSLLSALFNVPDLGVRDDIDRLVDLASPYPWASLCVAAVAAVATGLILSPLDLVKTRLLVTPSAAKNQRRTIPILRTLPSYLCPSSIIFPTILHSLIHPVLTLSTPLVLRARFMLDRDASPSTFSFAKLCTSSVALLIKLPLETVLRRGQVAVLSSPAYVRAIADGPGGSKLAGREATSAGALETIVPVGRYDGVMGTMHHIVSAEGSRPATSAAAAAPKGKDKKGKPKVAESAYRRGQGMEGLWRGWKVSWWGLVGLWVAGVVGGGGDGEF